MANPAAANSDPFGDDRCYAYAVDHCVEPGARSGFLAHRGPTLVREGSEEVWRPRIRWRDMESWLAGGNMAAAPAAPRPGLDPPVPGADDPALPPAL